MMFWYISYGVAPVFVHRSDPWNAPFAKSVVHASAVCVRTVASMPIFFRSLLMMSSTVR